MEDIKNYGYTLFRTIPEVTKARTTPLFIFMMHTAPPSETMESAELTL